MSSKIEVSIATIEAAFLDAQRVRFSTDKHVIELRTLLSAPVVERQKIRPCDEDVFNSGESACLVDIPKETAETICRGISSASGCKVDWHYIGGRVHIKALAPPELAELQATIERLESEAMYAAAGFKAAKDEIERLKSESFESLYNAAIDERDALAERLKGGQGGVQMAAVPVERCYDVRAKMIIAFNEARKNGGDLDDGLDAAYKSALRYSPSEASQPAPVSVVLPEREHVHSKTLPFRNPAIGDGYISGWNACLDKVKELNQ